MDSNHRMHESKSCAFIAWLQRYIFGGCCTLYTSIETTNKHRCRHQSSKGKPFVQQHLILTLLAQNTVLETDGFHHTSLSRRVSDLLSLFCIFHEQFFTVMLSTIPPFQSRFSGAGWGFRDLDLALTRRSLCRWANPAYNSNNCCCASKRAV